MLAKNIVSASTWKWAWIFKLCGLIICIFFWFWLHLQSLPKAGFRRIGRKILEESFHHHLKQKKKKQGEKKQAVSGSQHVLRSRRGRFEPDSQTTQKWGPLHLPKELRWPEPFRRLFPVCPQAWPVENEVEVQGQRWQTPTGSRSGYTDLIINHRPTKTCLSYCFTFTESTGISRGQSVTQEISSRVWLKRLSIVILICDRPVWLVTLIALATNYCHFGSFRMLLLLDPIVF